MSDQAQPTDTTIHRAESEPPEGAIAPPVDTGGDGGAQQAEPSSNGATPAPAPEPERSHAESRNSSQMFEFSSYVHVGPGAAECEDGENGACQNAAHFHAWIRLPNQFQVSSLREKADAASARKLRVLRDPESDSRAILDGELDELVRVADHDALVEAVANGDFLKDHMAAMNTVRTDEERGFETIEDDRERLRALEQLPAEERPQEEFEELQKHVAAYVDAVNEERQNIQRPLREALAQKSDEELVEEIRETRIQGVAREASEEAYALWQWYICTLRPKSPEKPGYPQERVYASVDHLKAAAPEVIAALRVGFQEIEAAAGRSLQAAADG